MAAPPLPARLLGGAMALYVRLVAATCRVADGAVTQEQVVHAITAGQLTKVPGVVDTEVTA